MSFGKNKMVIASCPLRVSLLGGSTDLEDFIQSHGYGQVISFPVNLYTYVSINKRHDGRFLIQYAETESVLRVSDIKNELVRIVLEYFNITTPITVALNADIPSHGSGLASSTSFMIAMIKATSVFKGLELSDFEICNIALKLERIFNPLVGRQDPMGCGLKGFKSLHFSDKHSISSHPFGNKYFKLFDFYLLPVSKNGRSSTNILKSLKIEERKPLLDKVVKGTKYLKEGDYIKFSELITESWELKKKTSPHIASDNVRLLEEKIKKIDKTVYYKLCGAGGGGYILLIKPKDVNITSLGILENNYYIDINIDNRGIKTWTLN